MQTLFYLAKTHDLELRVKCVQVLPPHIVVGHVFFPPSVRHVCHSFS